jgi:hypothetical protein
MYDPVRDIGNSINPPVNYFLETQHAGEVDSPYNRIPTRSTQAESLISSNSDLVIKPVDDQIPHNNLAFEQPYRPYFQLKLIPQCRQPPVKDLEEYSRLPNIYPKSYSSPQKSEQRPSRRRVGRRVPLSPEIKTRKKPSRNCQINKELVS